MSAAAESALVNGGVDAAALHAALPAEAVVYLSGPMTGMPDENRGAFREAATALRGRRPDLLLFDPGALIGTLGRGLPREAYLREDLRVLIAGWRAEAPASQRTHQVTDIVLLPGWETSDGAALEVAVAEAVGLRVWRPDGRRLPAGAVCVVHRAHSEPAEHVLPVADGDGDVTVHCTGRRSIWDDLPPLPFRSPVANGETPIPLLIDRRANGAQRSLPLSARAADEAHARARAEKQAETAELVGYALSMRGAMCQIEAAALRSDAEAIRDAVDTLQCALAELEERL